MQNRTATFFLKISKIKFDQLFAQKLPFNPGPKTILSLVKLSSITFFCSVLHFAYHYHFLCTVHSPSTVHWNIFIPIMVIDCSRLMIFACCIRFAWENRSLQFADDFFNPLQRSLKSKLIHLARLTSLLGLLSDLSSESLLNSLLRRKLLLARGLRRFLLRELLRELLGNLLLTWLHFYIASLL